MTATEEWADAPGWPGYRISNLGRVYSVPRRCAVRDGTRSVPGRFLTITRHHDRMTVRLSCQGVASRVALKDLVAKAFLAEARPSPRYRLAHRDGDPENCAARNLFWQRRGEAA